MIKPPQRNFPFELIEPALGKSKQLIVTNLLESIGWSYLTKVFQGVLAHQGIGLQYTGFRYPQDELDSEEEPFEGIEIYSPFGEVYVDPDDFDTLMLRFGEVVQQGALARNHPVLAEPFWPQFLQQLQTLRHRIQHKK